MVNHAKRKVFMMSMGGVEPILGMDDGLNCIIEVHNSLHATVGESWVLPDQSYCIDCFDAQKAEENLSFCPQLISNPVWWSLCSLSACLTPLSVKKTCFHYTNDKNVSNTNVSRIINGTVPFKISINFSIDELSGELHITALNFCKLILQTSWI